MYHGDRSRKEVLVEYGFRLPSALDNRPLNFEEWESRVGQVVFVSATPGPVRAAAGRRRGRRADHPADRAGRSGHRRPAGAAGRSTTCSARSASAPRGSERVLVTTLTKRMAEDLTQYYQELGVKVRYLHSDIDTLERDRDPARPAARRRSTCWSASTCCARGSTCRRCRWSRSSTPTRKASCARAGR